MKKYFLKRIVEDGLVLIHGHTMGIEWLANQMKQYKDGEILVEDNIVAIILTDPKTNEDVGGWVGIWVVKTDLFWEVLHENWGLIKNDLLVAVQIEAKDPNIKLSSNIWRECNLSLEIMTPKDRSHPTEFEIKPLICKSVDFIPNCAEMAWKMIDEYADWCQEHIEDIKEL